MALQAWLGKVTKGEAQIRSGQFQQYLTVAP